MSNATFLGNTDEVTSCDCCGRADLKSTVALSVDGSEPVYYGVVCAARALATTAKDVRQRARTADEARQERERAAAEAVHRAEFANWSGWLAQAAPAGTCVFTRIAALGGFTSARAAYEAR